MVKRYLSIQEACPKINKNGKKELESLKHSVRISDVNLTKFDAVYIPGGHGAMYDLPYSKETINAIEYFANANKIVASVCHGPASRSFIGYY